MNSTQTSACIRWEAFKAYIRGQILSFTSKNTKQANERMIMLDTKIKSLQEQIFQPGMNTTDAHRELLALRSESNKLSANMLRLKQLYYDQGEKPGKLLAWRIKQQQAERVITHIEDDEGKMTVDPMEINGAFRHYYENLYCSEGIYNLDIQSDFLGKLDIPQISEGTRDSLDGEITTLEISEAVSAMNAGKTAGPDGLPIDIYKML